MRLNLTLMLAMASASIVHGADYPARPLRLLVGLPAGGGADVIARIVMTKTSTFIGQPIVVENRPGSAGRIAAETVARAAPDGYTFLFGSPVTNAIAPLLYRDLSYNPRRDFSPISTVATLPNVLVVNVNAPARSVSELVAYAKANPKKLTYASSGTGGVLHLTMELFRARTDIDIVHVPYKGGVQAIPDLLSGQIQMMFEILPTQLPYIRTGKTRALAVTTRTRSPLLPEVPTMMESGIREFDVTMWYGLFAPNGVPNNVVAKVLDNVQKALASPEVGERLAQQGAAGVATTPQELATLIDKETIKWRTVISRAGIVATD